VIPKTIYRKNLIRDLSDNHYLSVKATLHRFAFRIGLKFLREEAFLISTGKLFHKVAMKYKTHNNHIT